MEHHFVVESFFHVKFESPLGQSMHLDDQFVAFVLFGESSVIGFDQVHLKRFT